MMPYLCPRGIVRFNNAEDAVWERIAVSGIVFAGLCRKVKGNYLVDVVNYTLRGQISLTSIPKAKPRTACCPFQGVNEIPQNCLERGPLGKCNPVPTCNPGLLFSRQYLDSERVPTVDLDDFVSLAN
ncbi:hypothetical protein CEXT_806511 [Caerostris extrusa]|uniref:Uncharacterized protein n=1 Tax=Caerostris extrusa TaxID=172846 RepID=A0AAV4UCB5_CAEEX|nr:hypothetical protein CEXT_806511 [Caerostris extrusa]